jgi:hypothetical protein
MTEKMTMVPEEEIFYINLSSSDTERSIGCVEVSCKEQSP